MLFMDKLGTPLTTVRFPHVQMGHEAARLLLDRLLGHTNATKHAVMPVTLVPRESTAAPRR
jgi:LacI family transcriptional regulator